MDYTETITHVSHCSGYEGIGLGLKRVFGSRLRAIAYCELEGYCQANLISKMEAGLLDAAPIWSDLKSFPFGHFYSLVDIYTVGFPCQPFSCAGKQEADNDPRHLWPYIRDGIERMQPKLVFLENVDAIISAKLKGSGWSDPEGTPVLLHVLRELERIGYRCTWGSFSAAEVGAPHRRKRVFILAHGKDCQRRLQLCAREWKENSEFGGRGETMADTGRECVRPRGSDGSLRCAPEGGNGHRDGGGELEHSEDTDRRREQPARESSKDRRTGFSGAGGSMADANGQRSQRRDGSELQECRREWTAWSGSPQLPEFPPGPNELDRWREIPEWLWPAVECEFRRVFDGASLGVDSNLNSYDTNKADTGKALPILQSDNGEEEDQQSVRGPCCVSKEEVLRHELHGESDDQSGCAEGHLFEANSPLTEGLVRELRHFRKAVDPSQGQELEKQRSFKLTDALFFVSHFTAPCSRGNLPKASTASMSLLREGFKQTGLQHWQNEIENTWDSLSVSQQEWATIAATVKGFGLNRVDRLRLIGNGCVPKTVAKAFVTLMQKLAL